MNAVAIFASSGLRPRQWSNFEMSDGRFDGGPSPQTGFQHTLQSLSRTEIHCRLFGMGSTWTIISWNSRVNWKRPAILLSVEAKQIRMSLGNSVMIFSDQKTPSAQAADILHWTECSDRDVFDATLVSFSGHPLQSTLWGNARNKVDGISQLLLEYRTDVGKVAGLARIERRSVPLLGDVAWLPRGPVLSNDDSGIAEASLRAELKRRGFIVCITDRYAISRTPHPQCPRTIWLDLTLGADTLSKALDAQWRYGAKHALREGVIVRTTTMLKEVSTFFHLCSALSVTKGFSLRGSEALMKELIRSSLPDGEVGMSLYVAEVDGAITGGAVVAKSGSHLHYLWGASDRRFSKYRVSEAIQWQIIQDGVASSMERYDLGGIDPVGNPGVYQFKRKMGGTEVALQGMEVSPLSWAGRVVVGVGHRLGRFG